MVNLVIYVYISQIDASSKEANKQRDRQTTLCQNSSIN